MSWSIQIARLHDIPIRLHLTFFMLMGAIIFHGLSVGDPALVIVSLGLFGSVLLHELGHSVTAQRLGIKVVDITLLPIGGLARMERIPREPREELLITAAGPLVNFCLAPLLWAAHTLFETAVAPELLLESSGHPLGRLAVLNLMLGLFNLVPAFPMDGGRLLRAFLAQRLPYPRATQIAVMLGQALAFALGFVGLTSQNYFWVLIAMLVFMGAGEEGLRVQTQAIVEGVRVRDAMVTQFDSLRRGDNLGRAADLLLSGSQHDFPVMEGDELVGILTRRRLLEGLAQAGREPYISEVMAAAPPPVTPDELLLTAMERMSTESASVLPVTEDGRLCGLLTAENTGEFVMVRAALSQRAAQSRRV
jgi:Zn-dependent protease/CBS domain-containing protein